MQATFQILPFWIQIVLAIAPALGAACAGVGLLINVRQSQRTNAQARASLVASCLKGFAEDGEIQKAFYAIEYRQFYFNEDFHGSRQEREIDKLLRHFANIALAWQAGLLMTADIKPIQYYMLRIISDPEIKRYMQFIEQISIEARIGEHPYMVLIRLCRTLEKSSPN